MVDVVERAGELVENLLLQLALLVLRLHLFEDGVFEELLLDQVAQLKRRHLQHLDALAQLGRQDEALRKIVW